MKLSLLHRIAIGCGATPLISGTVIYFAWRATHWETLEFLGIMNILIGLILFVVGVVCLIVPEDRDRRAPDAAISSVKRRNVFVFVLLLANFPAAAIFGMSALEVMGRYTVRVVNDSGAAVDDLTLSGPGAERSFADLAKNARVRCILRLSGAEGGLNFSTKQNGHALAGELDGYAMSGRDITLRLLPGGKYEVHDNDETSYLARE